MNVTEYLKETRAEMKHVNWPTRRQTVLYSTVVVAVSVFTAALLGVFDKLFTYLLGILIA